ncbi:MAG: nitrite reductase (NO-forming) [Crocinitomix sp.]|jgi:nitrite reductase (NO-forming)
MKYLAVLIFTFLLIACGGDKTEGWATDDMLVQPSEYIDGEKVYMSTCVACHQKDGIGLEGAFPPLANSDYLLADKNRAIEIAANGMEGEITVNGAVYNTVMAPQGLSNQEVMDVMNYVLNSWGNNGGTVTLAEVDAVMN